MSSKVHNVISADDHVQEPPDAWQSRVEEKLKSREKESMQLAWAGRGTLAVSARLQKG